MTLPTIDPSVLIDAGNLAAVKRAADAHQPQALKQAAQQFESLFVSMVLKSMRQANFKDPLFGSSQENLYQDLYDDQIAAKISQSGGLGLADMLVQQLRRQGVGGPAPAEGQAGTAGPPAGAGSPAGTAAHKAPASLGEASPGPSRASARPSAPPTASLGEAAGPTAAQQTEFVRSLWPAAEQASRQLGVSPVSLLAQAALETSWGRDTPRAANGASSHNLFGMKAGTGWGGSSVVNGTREFAGGLATRVDARFRAYGSPGECFRDYVALLRGNPRYAAALGTGNDVHAFATALQQGGYATDPAYAQKVCAVAASLTRALSQGGLEPLKSAAPLPIPTSGTV